MRTRENTRSAWNRDNSTPRESANWEMGIISLHRTHSGVNLCVVGGGVGCLCEEIEIPLGVESRCTFLLGFG